MAQLTNKQKKEWAKSEFLRGDLSQKEIAEKVGVSTVTMNKWVNDPEDNWDRLRKSMLITREAQLTRLYMQLDELNSSIMSKPQGKRFADSKEADTISKLAGAIKTLETEASISDVVEVSKRFLNWLRKLAPHKAKEVAAMFNDFIKDLLKR
jgi:transcriptional regulator with XRE-family HTH domain